MKFQHFIFNSKYQSKQTKENHTVQDIVSLIQMLVLLNVYHILCWICCGRTSGLQFTIAQNKLSLNALRQDASSSQVDQSPIRSTCVISNI